MLPFLPQDEQTPAVHGRKEVRRKKQRLFDLRIVTDETAFVKEFKELGCKPSAYVNRIRISAAKLLLTDTDMTVREIADRVGYSDVYYFSKVFKK